MSFFMYYLLNADTIEFRIFRGTLKSNTLLATLQLVDYICDVALFMSDAERKKLSWSAFVTGIKQPELMKMMDYVRRGDVVIVESISRFARNTKDLLELIEKLTAKGVEFISKKEAIDTTTPTGKFMLTIFGAVAELEREYILQRQKEGIAIAKEQGKYTGRKPTERPDMDKVISRWRLGDISAVQAMKELKVSKTTFYRLVKG